MARSNERRFEFIFSAVGVDTFSAPRLFANVHAVVQVCGHMHTKGAISLGGQDRKTATGIPLP